MTDPSTRIDQALHGYGHGHELLAASTKLDDATASVLSHNSDSAPNANVRDGPFLTGYPLADGRYVIAKTWLDEVADRPNTVITVSLLIPPGVKSSLSAEQLLRQLADPPQATAGGELPWFDVAEVSGPPVQLSPEEATVAAGFYAHRRALHAPSPSSRERIALAIWQQLWQSARYNLQFCTAPDTDRFSKTAWPLRFQSDSSSSLRSIDPPYCIVQDLQDPGPFREFVHFVGSGERAVGLMQPFAAVYSMLTENRLDPESLAGVLKEFKGTEPRRLRRLKRRVLGFRRGEAAWRIEPFDLLDALAARDLGNMIYASDASLDRWLQLCWELDPARTVDKLAGTVSGPEAPVGPPTAREGMSAVFTSNAPDLITPNTVAIAAALNSNAVSNTIWAGNNSELWTAWADLQPPIDVPAGEFFPEFDWAVPLRGTRHNTDALARILRRYPEALDQLIVLADTQPAPSDLTVELTGDAKRLIRFRLEHDDARLAGLARLADTKMLPRGLIPAAWIAVLKNNADEVVPAVGYLIARNSKPVAHEVAIDTFASLYSTLTGEGGTAAWARLDPHLRGERNSWDRCGRLTEDFVHLIRSYPPKVGGEVTARLRKRNPTAATAVERRIRSEVEKSKRKKFRVWDPTTW